MFVNKLLSEGLTGCCYISDYCWCDHGALMCKTDTGVVIIWSFKAADQSAVFGEFGVRTCWNGTGFKAWFCEIVERSKKAEMTFWTRLSQVSTGLSISNCHREKQNPVWVAFPSQTEDVFFSVQTDERYSDAQPYLHSDGLKTNVLEKRILHEASPSL